MIAGLFDHGALPALERTVQFTAARHKVLTHNIANLSTPFFKPSDLDPRTFQQELSRAIEQRRQRPNPVSGALPLDERSGGFEPSFSNENVLFHDQNNRDLERIMQRLAENTLAHNTAVEMIRNQVDVLRLAIRERV